MARKSKGLRAVVRQDCYASEIGSRLIHPELGRHHMSPERGPRCPSDGKSPKRPGQYIKYVYIPRPAQRWLKSKCSCTLRIIRDILRNSYRNSRLRRHDPGHQSLPGARRSHHEQAAGQACSRGHERFRIPEH